MAGPAPTPSPGADPPTPDVRTFDSALRGYERRQVDQFVADRTEEVARLLRDLAEAQRQRRLATEHAEGTERELRELRATMVAGGAEGSRNSFGYRAEKLLRLAEQEAAEARNHATRESAWIIELARTEAEKHRHDVEQNLISRAALLEQQAAQRAAELQDREQEMAGHLAAAREQADQLHSAAVRATDRLREDAEAAAQDTRMRAETAARRTRDQAGHELARLTALQSDVRAELARLAELLVGELPQDPAGEGSDGPDAEALPAAATAGDPVGAHRAQPGQGGQSVPASGTAPSSSIASTTPATHGVRG